MSTPRHISLLGGPSTGKSTFLGALVDALQTEQFKHLRLEHMADDARAFQRLVEPLLEGCYPQRTSAGERLELIAPLRTHGDFLEPLSFTLRAGDYDGEEVERLFRDRIHGWSDEWTERARSDGFLFLVRADAVSKLPRTHIHTVSEPDASSRWRQLRREPAAQEARRPERTAAAPSHPEQVFGPLTLDEVPPPPRAALTDPVAIPTVLSLIELLQFIRHVRKLAPGERPRGEERFRIALLVSAWDAVASEWRQKGPAAWLAHHLPLLEDFLWSNFLPDDVFRFGLSSTGGNLRNPEYSQEYQGNPHGFVEWASVDRILASQDIGLPLYWLLFGDSALGAL